VKNMHNEIACHNLFPKDQLSVLCDHTANETVQSEIMETKSLHNGMMAVGVRFEDVLMMKFARQPMRARRLAIGALQGLGRTSL
jgi:hypothetical protein